MGLQRVGHDWATELNEYNLRLHEVGSSTRACGAQACNMNKAAGWVGTWGGLEKTSLGTQDGASQY